MKQAVSISDILNSACGSLNDHLREEKPVKKKRAKYNNVKVEFDGFKFDSQRECNYYIGLRARQTAGQITDLRLQVPFQLNDGGTHSLEYIADFVWMEKGQMIVCDVKGYKTKLYLKKKKLMLEIYKIEIRET